MTLGELRAMLEMLIAELGEDHPVYVADHQSWLTSATERIVAYMRYVDKGGPVVLIYAGHGKITKGGQARG